MGRLPPWVDDRPLTNLDDAVAGFESSFLGCKDKFNMRPLIAMMVNVVRNLTKKNTLRFQNSISFQNERRVGVRKSVSHFFWRPRPQPKPDSEVLLLVSSLVRDVRGIIDDHVKKIVLKWHLGIVSDNARLVRGLYVHADDFAFGSSPESTAVYRGVQNTRRVLPRIELEQPFYQVGIFSGPDRGERCVLSRLRLACHQGGSHRFF